MMEDLSHPAIGAMIDTIPMALAGERPEDYLKVFGEQLVHVHFIDGAPRGHLAWGDGVLDMKGYLEEFSSFWVWLGCVVLIVAAGEAVATAAAGFRQKRKVSVYHVGDVTRVEVENAGRADIPAAVKALNEQAAEVDE